jgi:hypothetical protein
MARPELQRGLDRAGACLLVALPVILLAYDLAVDTATPSGFAFGFLAAWIIGAAFLALARLAWRASPRLTLVAGALALMGLLGTMDITSFRFLSGMIRATPGAVGDPGRFGVAIEAASPYAFFPGLITPLSLLFFALILARAERPYRWAWLCAAAGAVLFPFGRVVAGPLGILLSDALLLAGLGYRAYRLVDEAPSPAGSAVTS